MPRTLPSVDSEVVAGCMEHPLISAVVALSQSKMVEPLDVVVPGLILFTVSKQNDGSISEHSSQLVRTQDLLIVVRQSGRSGISCPSRVV